MNAQSVIVDVLLGLAVLLVAISSLGIVFMPDVFQKLHYVTPAALLAPVLVALAVTVAVGWSSESTDSWLAVLFVVVTGPVLAHATARAARARHAGDWAQSEGVTLQPSGGRGGHGPPPASRRRGRPRPSGPGRAGE